MKKFQIKIIFKNGYTIEEVEAKSFGAACEALESKSFMAGAVIKGFELIEFSEMRFMPGIIPVSVNHGLKFSVQED